MKNKEIKAITEKRDGRLIAIASTESEDRVGDSLKMTDWDLKNYLKNPVLQAGHKHDPQFTIGVAKNIKIDGKTMTFEPEFHTITQLAKDIKSMYEEGILKAWSVGFIPGALVSDKGVNELLEISAVAVPANAECLTELKGIDSATGTEIKTWIQKSLETEEDSVEEKTEEADAETQDEKVEETVEENKEEVKEENAEEIVEEENEDETTEEATKSVKKEAEETVTEQINEDEKRRKKWELVDKVDTAIYAFYKVYMDTTTEVSEFTTLVKELSEILVGIADNTEVKALKLKNITGSFKDLIDLREESDEKEGKVLSKKNKKLVNDSVLQIKNTAAALEKLLEASETSSTEEATEEKSTPEKAKGSGNEKSREPKAVNKQELVILRALQKIAGSANYALQTANKKVKK